MPIDYFLFLEKNFKKIIFPLFRDIEEKGTQSSTYRGLYSHLSDEEFMAYKIHNLLVPLSLSIDNKFGSWKVLS